MPKVFRFATDGKVPTNVNTGLLLGYQNNTLILGPGGFRFGDYWKLGLPLEGLVVGVSIPLLLIVWPL